MLKNVTLSEIVAGLTQAGGTEGYGAVLLRYSLIPPSPKRHQCMEVAKHAFTNFVYGLTQKPLPDKIPHHIPLENSDHFFFFPLIDQPRVLEAVQSLRTLFSDEDWLNDASDRAVDQLQSFDSWFELGRDTAELLKLAGLYDQLKASGLLQLSRLPNPAAPTNAPLERLEPKSLANVLERLADTDLTAYINRQAVCAIGQGSSVQPMFHECYVALQSLQAALCPTISLSSDRWLFQYLTRILDQRILALALANLSRFVENPISLNLHIETLLSEQFLAFDQQMTENGLSRGKILIELQRIDIFSDFGAFSFARDFLLERGYSICIDGMTHLSLRFIDRSQLKVDFIKMLWTPELQASMPPARLNQMAELVRRAGKARIILTRCDNDAALAFGRAIGISLFQGHYFDQLLQLQAKDGGT
jgi:EAL domain-containing protein (putative c-di-GMP-specific phosphodiesterase class I)